MTAIGMKDNEYLPVTVAVHIDSNRGADYMALIDGDFAGWGLTPEEATVNAVEAMTERLTEGVPA